jgi:hypothetical protein
MVSITCREIDGFPHDFTGLRMVSRIIMVLYMTVFTHVTSVILMVSRMSHRIMTLYAIWQQSEFVNASNSVNNNISCEVLLPLVVKRHSSDSQLTGLTKNPANLLL